MSFSGPCQLEANLRKLAEVPARASKQAAASIQKLVDAEFAAQSDPYGKPWAAHAGATVERWGAHPIHDLTGDEKSGVKIAPRRGAGIRITFETDYSRFHQTGTADMPARPVLPSNVLPAAWNKAIRDACEASAAKVLK